MTSNKPINEYINGQKWATRVLGEKKFCEECGSSTAKKYGWSSISGKQKRVASDWKRLCLSCLKKDRNKKLELVEKDCNICGSKFSTRIKKQIYCSNACIEAGKNEKRRQRKSTASKQINDHITEVVLNIKKGIMPPIVSVTAIKRAGYNVSVRRKWVFLGEYQLKIYK